MGEDVTLHDLIPSPETYSSTDAFPLPSEILFCRRNKVMKCDILPHLYRWWRMSLLQQDSRGHLTFMAVNQEIPKYLDATLWNRGFVDTNGKYYELWNAQA